MATVVLQTAGAAIGQFFGGPIGAVIGQTVGAVAGSAIDQRLFGTAPSDGPRLSTMPALASTEGAPIPWVAGRVRLGGQVIWATRFEESRTKGSAGGKSVGRPQSANYAYYANFAVGLCEGPISGVRRIWADGREIDQTRFTIRVYEGREDQQPDALIVAKEGAQNAPAYRGLAYVVFEHMALADFGNRIPQLSFEIVRPVSRLASMIQGVNIIPGAGEFAYGRRRSFVAGELGASRAENRNTLVAATDFTASLDALQQTASRITSATLVVSWFGDDLRAESCTLTPRVESASKRTSINWSVAGLSRRQARTVSQRDGRPAYGGTPTDETVIEAIQDMRARGLSVVFYPFVMMDIPADNKLPDPWSDNSFQSAYPWRGRITCHPAPVRIGTPDLTAVATAQVDSFFGSKAPGADEWSYRRFILHYAHLCVAAGGVDGFLIGSELAALTRVRAAPGVYPAVHSLVKLAADVKKILGDDCKVSYAADWTEYGAHVTEGGLEVRFPLDPLWSSPSIDFVGLDFYPPLSDWRDGRDTLDARNASSIYDIGYLRQRVAGGEGFDWYYSDMNARADQARSTIADGTYAKPWVFRQKDLVGWWSNLHIERSGGIEEVTSTGWLPCSKPIWLIEIGCPAVDRGSNAPNIFPDPKSSESGLPYFSRGHRDDLMQARVLEAIISRFDPAADGFEDSFNPVSPVYGERMVDVARIHVWAWDARPWPAFPQMADVWSDGASWATGHWLNGRIEGASLDMLLTEICTRTPGVPPALVRTNVHGWIDGYILDRPMSARSALEPLANLFAFDAVSGGGSIRFETRARRDVLALNEGDLVASSEGSLVEVMREQESEAPSRFVLSFLDGERDYRPANVHSRQLETGSARELVVDAPLVLTRSLAQQRCEVRLQDIWAAREIARFRLRPSFLNLELGDLVSLPTVGGKIFRIGRIVDAEAREIEAHSCEPSIYEHPAPVFAPAVLSGSGAGGPPSIHILDLALVRPGLAALQYVAAYADPWPGAIAVWRRTGEGYIFERLIEKRAVVGLTLDPLGPGVTSRFDRANSICVRMSGPLASLEDSRALSGENLLALRGEGGAWEVVAFAQAQLVSSGVYRLSRLVRGLGGQDVLAARTLPAGAPVVFLDDAVTPLVSYAAMIGASQSWKFSPADTDYADELAVGSTALVTDLSLRPYAPRSAKAVRGDNGIKISIVRRGRIESDGWGLLEIPLGEDIERYRVDVLFEGGVRRTLFCEDGASALYQHEIADFGEPQGSLTLRVSQVSAAVGEGFSRILQASVE